MGDGTRPRTAPHQPMLVPLTAIAGRSARSRASWPVSGGDAQVGLRHRPQPAGDRPDHPDEPEAGQQPDAEQHRDEDHEAGDRQPQRPQRVPRMTTIACGCAWATVVSTASRCPSGG
jgi:hypothetical protein